MYWGKQIGQSGISWENKRQIHTVRLHTIGSLRTGPSSCILKVSTWRQKYFRDKSAALYSWNSTLLEAKYQQSMVVHDHMPSSCQNISAILPHIPVWPIGVGSIHIGKVIQQLLHIKSCFPPSFLPQTHVFCDFEKITFQKLNFQISVFTPPSYEWMSS